jgi:hypothetical protein
LAIVKSKSFHRLSSSDDYQAFYPEVRDAGSLRTAFLHALKKLGSPFVPDAVEWFPVAYTRVAGSGRASQIYLAASNRLFLPDFWSKGVCLGCGECSDLDETALAIHRWLSQGPSIFELSNSFVWVKPKAGAEAYELGHEVDWKWECLIQDADSTPDFRVLAARTAVEPRLRELFPYTSMGTLCFSRRTDYPFTRDTPSITPIGNGQYQVADGNGKKLGRGDVEGAIQLAVTHLPLNCGPAKAGTADDEV